MTFMLNERYPGRVNPPSSKYPRGSFKNRTSPSDNDGTYLEEEWKNDERGFFDRIVNVAKIVPNGQIDDGENSQLYDGLMQIVSEMITAGAAHLYGQAVGGSDAISVTLQRPVVLANGLIIYVRAQYANTTTAPTLKVGDFPAKAIVKGNNRPLSIGDIAGAGYVMQLTYDQNFDRWILLNPALGVIIPQTIPVGTIAYFGRTGEIDGWLLMDNREHQRSQYPQLVQQCPQLILPGSTGETFKLIDPRGYFLRVLDSGKGVDTGRAFGSQQGDAIRNISGTFAATDRSLTDLKVTGAFQQLKRWSTNYAGGNADSWGYQAKFDASLEVPTAGENRPKNFAFPVYVKY